MDSNLIKPTWYILGAGAIGCLWASYWRQAGFPVVLITPSPRQQSFIELDVKNKTTQIDVEHITIDQLAASKQCIEYLLVSTKAQHTLKATSAIQENIDEKATLLILQNGMAAKQLPALFINQTIITAITTDGAYRTGQQAVVHAGHGITHVGCEPSFLAYLPTQQLNIEACDDIEVRQWNKLAINCAINGLTAIYQCRNGELLSIPQAKKRIEKLCDEVVLVADALKLSPALSQLMDQVENTLCTTAENYSSMYQDVHHRRSTEIDFINGYLCEVAESHSIDCQENQRIVFEIKQLQNLT